MTIPLASLWLGVIASLALLLYEAVQISRTHEERRQLRDERRLLRDMLLRFEAECDRLEARRIGSDPAWPERKSTVH